MKILTFIVAVVFSIFSTAVMSYISMAIPIGPWIAPTLALIGIIIFYIFNKKGSDNCQQIALATFAGSVGGIIATAIGFYFTTIYFLDPILFTTWFKKPLDFSVLVASLSLVASFFGLWVANIFENKLIVYDKLSFPIGELVHKTISAQKTLRKSIELAVNKDVFNQLTSVEYNSILQLEKNFNCAITILEDKNFLLNQYKIKKT